MSATPRLFVKADLMMDGPVALDTEQGNYLFRVLRLEQGAPVRVFNGRHGEWRAVIEQKLGGKTGLLRVTDFLRAQGDLPDLHLLFAPLKKTRTDFVVEKATELGVTVIQPVITERTQTHRVNVSRLNKVALEAAEQTERLTTPQVLDPQPLFQSLQSWPKIRALYFADEAGSDDHKPWGGENGRATTFPKVLEGKTPGPSAILIGPEGGFSESERTLLREQEFVTPVGLGPRILRAETAAVAALTIWQSRLGDWQQ